MKMQLAQSITLPTTMFNPAIVNDNSTTSVVAVADRPNLSLVSTTFQLASQNLLSDYDAGGSPISVSSAQLKMRHQFCPDCGYQAFIGPGLRSLIFQSALISIMQQSPSEARI